MQTVDNTPTGWSEVIAELEQKHASAMTHIEQLRAQKHKLALDAASVVNARRSALPESTASLRGFV